VMRYVTAAFVFASSVVTSGGVTAGHAALLGGDGSGRAVRRAGGPRWGTAVQV
jgi:hypothetical protein